MNIFQMSAPEVAAELNRLMEKLLPGALQIDYMPGSAHTIDEGLSVITRNLEAYLKIRDGEDK